MDTPFLRANPSIKVSRALVVAAILLTGACGCSTARTTQLYTLSPVAIDSAQVAQASEGAIIAIGPVALPDYVDRQEIVVRLTPNTVKHATFDQWAGDLDEMVPFSIVENLELRLPDDHFTLFPDSGDQDFRYRVPITISRFDVSASGGAVIAARWQVRGPAGTGTLLLKDTTTRAAATGESYDELVTALSEALASLTDEIAATLSTLRREQAAQAAESVP